MQAKQRVAGVINLGGSSQGSGVRHSDRASGCCAQPAARHLSLHCNDGAALFDGALQITTHQTDGQQFTSHSQQLHTHKNCKHLQSLTLWWQLLLPAPPTSRFNGCRCRDMRVTASVNSVLSLLLSSSSCAFIRLVSASRKSRARCLERGPLLTAHRV